MDLVGNIEKTIVTCHGYKLVPVGIYLIPYTL